MIKGLAESLKDAFPGENSTIIRMGGDEFLLICCDTDEAEARERMDVLRIELKNKKINKGISALMILTLVMAFVAFPTGGYDLAYADTQDEIDQKQSEYEDIKE